jgi:hypothetical protein
VSIPFFGIGSATPSPVSVCYCLSPWTQRGEEQHPCGRGVWEDPIRTTGKKARHSVYSVGMYSMYLLVSQPVHAHKLFYNNECVKSQPLNGEVFLERFTFKLFLADGKNPDFFPKIKSSRLHKYNILPGNLVSGIWWPSWWLKYSTWKPCQVHIHGWLSGLRRPNT